MDRFVLLVYFAGVSYLMMVTVVTSTKWDLPDSCRGQSECVDYMSDSQWDKLTAECCADLPDTVYHCQEHDGQVIVACLVPVTCPPGQVSMLTEKPDGSGRHVSLSCKECDNGFFQPYSIPSFRYRYPLCQRTKQTCPAVSGRVLVSEGDSSQDSRCRCRWEEGWVPRFAGSRSQCTDPAGFVRDDTCDCAPHDCAQGMLPGKDYKCSVPNITPATPERSTTDGRRHEYIQNENQFPGGLSKERTRGEESRRVYIVLLSVLAAILVVMSVAAIVYGCIKVRKTYKTD